jgi:hypothetical protein
MDVGPDLDELPDMRFQYDPDILSGADEHRLRRNMMY